MKLYIAEKPNVAKAIAAVLGVAARQDGHIKCKNGDLVTWCFGHLMEQAEPEAYLPEEGKKIWRVEDLPILPDTWQNVVKKDAKKQFSLIGKLLKQCECAVNCGDCDREGQLLVDEVLEHYRYKGRVLRYWSSANDEDSVREALQHLKPNGNYKGMRDAALGRTRADWLIGMNGTRAFTLAQRRLVKGKAPVLSVGRVQTPTLNLVAERDLLIRNFKPKPYYVLKGQFEAAGVSFVASYKPKAGEPGTDEQGRLADTAVAKALMDKLQQTKSATVISCESAEKKAAPPKGYSLADLQNAANAKFGYSSEQTLEIAQSLYEKHKLTSYPRSDCQYLPKSQLKDVGAVFAALGATNPSLKALLDGADKSRVSAIWDDKKISAHHAIIPTRQKGSLEALSPKERNVYDLIVKRYVAQFYPDKRSNATVLQLDVAGTAFTCQGVALVDPGWRKVYGSTEDDDEESARDKDSKDEADQKIPNVAKGDGVAVVKIGATTKKTTAPAAFTEGSLIKAMENISSVVDDPKYRQALKQVKGIGTSATRAAIISELKDKRFMVLEGKQLHVTQLGRLLLSRVDPLLKDPVMTAMFEMELEKIEKGQASLADFEQKNRKYAAELVARAAAMDAPKEE